MSKKLTVTRYYEKIGINHILSWSYVNLVIKNPSMKPIIKEYYHHDKDAELLNLLMAIKEDGSFLDC
jgi:hypothetical protein